MPSRVFSFKISTIFILYYKLCYVSALNFQMLRNFQDSRIDDSSLTIKVDDLIPNLWLTSSLTLSVESTFILDSCWNDNYSFVLFEIGDTQIPIELGMTCDQSILEITFVSSSKLITKPARKIKSNGELHFVIVFFFKIDTSNSLSLSLVSDNLDNSTLSNLENVEITSVLFSQISDTIMKINFNKDTKLNTQIKNVYAIDKFFSSSDDEFNQFDRGLALLKQAIYFYMEAENAKILLNRSKHNYMYGTNGKLDEKCWEVHSHFNKTDRVTVWTMQNFNNEVFQLPLDLVGVQPDLSFSVVLNLEIYPRLLESLYLDASTTITFAHFLDGNQDTKFSLIVNFDNYNSGSQEISYQIVFGFYFDASLITFSATESVNAFEPLSIESIQIYFDVKSASSGFFHLKIIRKNFPDFESSGVAYNPSNHEIRSFILGNLVQLQTNLKPPFMINLFDILVFDGGYFLTQSDNPKDIRMVSLDTLEIMYCEGNRRISRYSGNEVLDAVFENQKMVSSSCQDMVFNYNCLVANCEICAQSQCLVCEMPFILNNGECNTSASEFEPLSRIDLSFQGENVQTIAIKKNDFRSVNLDSSKQGISLSMFDKNSSQTELQREYVDFFDFQCEIFTNRLIQSDTKSTLFGDNALLYNRLYVPISPSGTVLQYSSHYEPLSFDYIYFDDLCSLAFFFFNANYQLFFCQDIRIDFSKNRYFPLNSTSNSNEILNTFKHTISSKNIDLTFSCKNNCDCSKGSSIHECDSVLSPCEPLKYIDMLSSFPTISTCLECHSDCTHGCTGPLKSNCFKNNPKDTNCADPCEICDPDLNCLSCPAFGMNMIFYYDERKSEYNSDQLIFCSECRSLCAVCQSLVSCTCEHSRRMPFVGFESKFNICLRRYCDNCLECDTNGKCSECREGFFLLNGKCEQTNLSKCTSNKIELCKECFFGYYLENHSCKKCSSKCKTCIKSESNQVLSSSCQRCENEYFLFEKKCFRKNKQSNFIPLINRLHDFTSEFWGGSISLEIPFCSKYKNSYSSVCLKCIEGYFLYSLSTCKKCQELALSCKSTKNKTPTIIKCKKGFYLDNSKNKCFPCSANCLSCSIRKCHICKPSFKQYRSQCISCSDPNCELCSNDSCFKCKLGFFFSEELNLCLPCSNNCMHCSKSNCLKCFDNYELRSDNLCIEKCFHGNSFFSQSKQKCVSCNFCEFCFSKGPTDCSSCSICKRECQLDFIVNNSYSFTIRSNEIYFPSNSNLEYTMKPNLTNEVKIKGDSKFLNFTLLPWNPFSTQIITNIDTSNFITKTCSIQSRILLSLPFPDSVITMIPEIDQHILFANDFISVTYQTGLIFSSVTPASTGLNFLVLLITTNQMFQYSFIKKNPQAGIYAYFSKMIRRSQNHGSEHHPLDKSIGEYYFHKSLEFYIFSEDLLSLYVLICLLVIFLYLYFEFFYRNKNDDKVKELGYLFMNRRMDKKYMVRFFRIFRKKLSQYKMYEINLYFRKNKFKKKGSPIVKKVRRLIRSIYKNRFMMVFFTLQLYGVPLSHLCAKSSKILAKFETSLSIMTLCFSYHMILGALFSISYMIYCSHLHSLEKYVYENDTTNIKEYFVLSMNIYSLVYSLIYVYVIVLFGNVFSAKVLNCVGLLFLLLTFAFDSMYNRRFKLYITVKFFHNLSTVLLIGFSFTDDELFFSMLSDSMFVFVNASTFILEIYFLFGKYLEKKMIEFTKEENEEDD